MNIRALRASRLAFFSSAAESLGMLGLEATAGVAVCGLTLPRLIEGVVLSEGDYLRADGTDDWFALRGEG